VGGSDEVLKIVEEGLLGDILEGLPKKRAGSVCEGCGEARFLPCFQCNGSSKMVLVVEEEVGQRQGSTTVVVRCPECNENGLVLCPICS
jgi:glutaredoxin domain-containing cysteine-rich protein 1